MAEIDSLEIKIESSAKSASATLDKLVSKLDVLATSLNKINVSRISSEFEKLSRSMSGINGNIFKNFSESAKAAENSMKSVAKEASKGIKAKATFDISDYEKVSDELGKKFADAGKNIQFSGNLLQLEKQYESLSKAFDKLSEKEQKIISVGTTSPESAAFKGLQYDISTTLNKMETLSDKIKQLKSLKSEINIAGMESINQTLKEFEEELKHFNDVINSGGQEDESGTFFPISGIEMSLEQLRNLYPEATNLISAFESAAERARELSTHANQDFGNIDLSAFDKAGEKVKDFGQKTEEVKRKIQEVDSASKKTEGIDKLSSSFSKASNSGKKLSKTLSKMQNNFKNLLRSVLPFIGTMQAINFTKSSISNAMDYIETLNYFDAAFGQVAQNADLSAFKQLGYDSADAYYNSFAERAEQLTAKMSGFTIDEKGMLQSTGTVSLGLDPAQLMNYQAMFGQMASSMGVSSEIALKLSQTFTELGADLASVKNLDFEDVWNDMASGLAGMSRTLDKYGVNIRNVNLQQKLNELGIEANISALNQNDKALLRAIILLDSTRYAWADLADTINQPANQLRMIQANFQNLSRTIGSLFMPLVQKILPYVNALVIAVQRLFSWLGNLMGIDLSNVSTVVGGADLGNILDQTEDLGGGLGDAKKAADKLNKSLQKFDELNVITTKQDDGGTGIGRGIGGGLLDEAFGKAFDEYQKKWDEAFVNLENRAQEIADSIEKAFEPIKKIIQDFAVGDFFQAGKDVSALVVSITDFFTKAIKKVDWYKIGQNIGKFFAGIDWVKILKSVGKLIWTALKSALKFWKGAFDAAPIETGIITAIGLLKFTKLGSVLKSALLPQINKGLDKIVKGLNLKKVGIGIAGVFGEITLVSDAFEGLTRKSQGVGSALGEIVTGAGLAVGALKLIGLSNPWTAVITGAGLAAGAIIGVKQAQKEALEELDRTQELEVFGDSVENLTQKWDANAEAIRNRIAAANEYIESQGVAEAEIARNLADRYFELSEKENLTNEEKEEMVRLAERLVELTPQLEEHYNTETGLIDATKESVKQLIDARLKEVQLKAVEDELTQAYKDRMTAMADLEEQSKDLYSAQEEFQRLDEAYKAQENILNMLKEYNGMQEKIVGSLKDSQEQYAYMNGSTAGLSEETQKLIDRQQELRDILSGEGIDVYSSKAFGEITKQMQSIRTEMDLLEEDNIEIMVKFANSENAFREVEDHISRLNSMWTESAISEAGTEGYTQKVMTYISGASEIVKNEGYGTGYSYIKEIDTGMDKAMEDVNVSEKTKKFAEDATDGYESEFEDTRPLEDAVGEYINAGLDTVPETQKSNSPSKITMEYGKDFVDGYNKGIEDNKETTINTVNVYVNSILGKLSEMTSLLREAGSNAMMGLLDGLSSMEDDIYSKAGEIADNVAKTVKNALEIHSPSKVMYKLGDFTMQGFQEGLENLYKPISESINGFSANLQVRPVLDVGNYEIALPPSFDSMYYNYRRTAEQYMPMSASYGTYGGIDEETAYRIAYNAVSSAIANSKLLGDQKDMVEGILKKPSVGIGELGAELARDSWIHGGNTNTSGIRLAVASEIHG